MFVVTSPEPVQLLGRLWQDRCDVKGEHDDVRSQYDVTLITEGASIRAYKCILVAASNYFKVNEYLLIVQCVARKRKFVITFYGWIR